MCRRAKEREQESERKKRRKNQITLTPSWNGMHQRRGEYHRKRKKESATKPNWTEIIFFSIRLSGVRRRTAYCAMHKSGNANESNGIGTHTVHRRQRCGDAVAAKARPFDSSGAVSMMLCSYLIRIASLPKYSIPCESNECVCVAHKKGGDLWTCIAFLAVSYASAGSRSLLRSFVPQMLLSVCVCARKKNVYSALQPLGKPTKYSNGSNDAMGNKALTVLVNHFFFAAVALSLSPSLFVRTIWTNVFVVRFGVRTHACVCLETVRVEV